MNDLAGSVNRALQPLLGLMLSSTSFAASMRGFQFGDLTRRGRGLIGKFALHVDCPWRIERDEEIITGSRDWYEPAEEPVGVQESFNPEKGESLQQRKLRDLLKGFDESSKSILNSTEQLIVDAVEADSYGGFRIELSGGYRLSVFPAGSRGEAWRIFHPSSDQEHFVIEFP